MRKKDTGLHVETVTKLSDFVSFVEECCTADYFLFRGQNCDWPLIPKIGRVQIKKELLESETEMMEDFKRLSKPYIEILPNSELEWLSLAQHHGMATRLLDWTTNPLAAAWFAVAKPCQNEYGVIWMFDAPQSDIIKAGQAGHHDPYTGKRTKVFQPNITSNRIQSQNGWFTLHKYHETTGTFTSFEKNNLYKKYLTKVIIPKEYFDSFRYQLDRLGVNERSLFPDLDGTANYVEWLHSYLEDEKSG